MNHICVHTHHPGSLWIYGRVRENGVKSNKNGVKKALFSMYRFEIIWFLNMISLYALYIYQIRLWAYVHISLYALYIYRFLFCAYIVLCSVGVPQRISHWNLCFNGFSWWSAPCGNVHHSQLLCSFWAFQRLPGEAPGATKRAGTCPDHFLITFTIKI